MASGLGTTAAMRSGQSGLPRTTLRGRLSAASLSTTRNEARSETLPQRGRVSEACDCADRNRQNDRPEGAQR